MGPTKDEMDRQNREWSQAECFLSIIFSSSSGNPLRVEHRASGRVVACCGDGRRRYMDGRSGTPAGRPSGSVLWSAGDAPTPSCKSSPHGAQGPTHPRQAKANIFLTAGCASLLHPPSGPPLAASALAPTSSSAANRCPRCPLPIRHPATTRVLPAQPSGAPQQRALHIPARLRQTK